MAFDSILSMYSGPGDIVGCNMTSRRSRPDNHYKSRASLLSKVSSQVHIIAWQDLLRVMRVYPEIRTRIMEQMVLAFELDSNDMVSDLRIKKTTCSLIMVWNNMMIERFSFECRKVIVLHFLRFAFGLKTRATFSSNQK